MENPFYTIIALLFVHFIADFVCQNDKMALNKSKSVKWLTIHVLVYTLVLFFGAVLILQPNVHTVIAEMYENKVTIYYIPILGYVFLNAVLHWVTDFFTSRLNSFLLKKFAPSHHWFFVGVGFDQFIHTSTLILTYQYFILN